jgi:hypothetical protein
MGNTGVTITGGDSVCKMALRNRFLVRLYFLTSLILFNQPSTAASSVHCFVTNDIEVCHNMEDFSVFYDTPFTEVAYNVQVIHDASNYYYVWHAEPKGKLPGTMGDSIKTSSTANEPYSFRLPLGAFRIWGNTSNKRSLLYFGDNVGGGGNPMVISGISNDPYFYVFFLGATDDDRTRKLSESKWRQYLLEVRTREFESFEIRTDNGWEPFSETSYPAELLDADGKILRSNNTSGPYDTQGLIGSISYVGGLYHFFYTDYAISSKTFNFFHRTSRDVRTGPWSAPELIASNLIPGVLIRVAKAPDMNRWIMMNGCYVDHKQDICLQYTQNLKIVGSGGISDLEFPTNFTESQYALGFSSGSPKSLAQAYWLTDRWGNIQNIDNAAKNRGGEFYWSDFSQNNCKIRPSAGCPVVGGKVYRSGWDISVSGKILKRN